jgi:hypothetical protein
MGAWPAVMTGGADGRPDPGPQARRPAPGPPPRLHRGGRDLAGPRGGLNTTLFSVVNAVLLRDTPVQRPERLVEVYSSLSDEFQYLTSSHPDYLSLHRQSRTLSGLAAHAFVRGILVSGDKPALVTGETITPSYFDVLGVRPALGRTFNEDENVADRLAFRRRWAHSVRGRFARRHRSRCSFHGASYGVNCQPGDGRSAGSRNARPASPGSLLCASSPGSAYRRRFGHRGPLGAAARSCSRCARA